MPLPHYTNIKSHNQNWEPVFNNLFEVVVLLPPAIAGQHPDHQTLLLENITDTSFPTYKAIESVAQNFKFSTRNFLKVPGDTSTELKLSINMNVNDDYQVFTWRMMKDWYDLVWNNEDGSLHYKSNIISDIVVHAHDKEGHVIRRVTYFNCQIQSITGWEALNWTGNEIQSLDVKFIADYWSDMYY